MSGLQDTEVVLMLPAVETDSLDRVLTSAGTRVPAAFATLISALAWLVVHAEKRRADRDILLRGIGAHLAKAVALHETARGHG